jgi:hypothetical protein
MRGIGATIALSGVFCGLVVAAVAVLYTVTDHEWSFFTNDPSSTFETTPYVGLMTHAGVLLAWGAAAVTVAAGAFLARARGRHAASPLFVFGAATAYLALDDLFLLHEDLFPRKLGGGEDLVYAAYVAIAAGLAWWYRDVLAHEWPLLALALGTFGASTLLDFGGPRYIEEPIELFGLGLLAAYLVRLSAAMLVDAYPVVARSSPDPANAVATPRPT